MTIKEKRDPPVCIRLSRASMGQLDVLMRLWGENRSKAISRALEISVEKMKSRLGLK